MRNKTLVAALALAMVSSVAVAADGDKSERRGERPARMTLDADGDGAISREEAARFPRLAERFDALDKNSDGKLDAQELPRRHGMRGARGGHDGKGHRGHRGGPGMHGFAGGRGHGGIERLDSDGDGRVTREELSAAAASDEGERRRGSRMQAGVLEKFDQIDSNGDGAIVRAEWRVWQEAQRGERMQAFQTRFDERFAAADSDSDGKLSKAEVEAAMPRLAARFAWMDEDRDGYLSREELQPRRGTR